MHGNGSGYYLKDDTNDDDGNDNDDNDDVDEHDDDDQNGHSGHYSANFQARSSRFCMVIDLYNTNR